VKIDPAKCVGCGKCRSYCTMLGGIMHYVRDPKSPSRVVYAINEDECVECGVCLRSGCCPTEALFQPPLEFPRIVRKNFSDPLKIHPETRVPGRGTEEMKTNDVTGRYGRGWFGMAFEMGRPGVGTRFHDVEKVAMALAAEIQCPFEENNPVTKLMTDRGKGTINPQVHNEKVLSAIIEFLVPEEKLPRVFKVIDQVSRQIRTVFSGDIIARVGTDGSIPYIKIAEGMNRYLSINGKSNLGLGRPLARI
jgi:ferredoxin